MSFVTQADLDRRPVCRRLQPTDLHLYDPRVVRIRDALADDVGPLEALQRRASLVWDDYRDQLLAHPDAIVLDPAAVADGLVRVAVDDVDEVGGRLGFTAAVWAAGGERVCVLDGLFVEPAAWGRGIGRALVEDVVGRAALAGAHRLEVIANPRALGFYERTGFVVVDAAKTRFGPAPRMRRELRPADGRRGGGAAGRRGDGAGPPSHG